VSKWLVISQEETDAFAKLTDDEDPMHNDPSGLPRRHGAVLLCRLHTFCHLGQR